MVDGSAEKWWTGTRPWTVENYVTVIERSAAHLAARARQAGHAATIPTCPRWTVADLVAHQGIVHRWATSHLRGSEEYHVAKAEVLASVPTVRLVDWLEQGAADLVVALRQAPDELQAMVFLRDAPEPRLFWARRQAHETTVHAVDALAAVTGSLPSAEQAGIDPVLALDGLDELLCGFVPRGRSKLSRQDGSTLAVVPSGAQGAWVLALGERLATERVRTQDPACRGATVTFSGSPSQLYLGLWNRGDEVASSDPELLRDWHGAQRVRWS